MNKKFIRALADRLSNLRHERHYNQRTWGTTTRCGTAACIAGHAVLLGGYRLAPLSPEDKDLLYVAVPKGMTAAAARRDVDWQSDTGKYHVATIARRLLGLTQWQATLLFESNGMDWPEKYGDRLRAARYGDSDERPSRIAAEMLYALADGRVSLPHHPR